MQRTLITGANRGLGLEFSRQLVARGGQVFAACRDPGSAEELRALGESHPGRLHVVRLDVGDPASIAESERLVRSHADGLELLINNAGVYMAREHAPGEQPDERPGTLDLDEALRVLRVNAVSPLLIAQQYLELLRAGRDAKIASISSGYGSVSENTGGFPYYYSASKAALNQFMRSLAADLKPSGVTTVLLNPGWVQTRMGGPQATLTPRESVAGMIRVLDSLRPKDAGRFLNWRGEDEPW
jgi:NAD(P)-dependent dehydrogenase (short-subunit alcohol dehydrogenase family)